MLVSFRSLVFVSRRRAVRIVSAHPSERRAGAAGGARTLPRAGVEVLEDRVFLSADVLPPAADTFVRDPSFNRTNFGDSPFLYVKTAGSGDSRVAYLKFDVGNWSSAQIGSATLYLAGALQTPTTPTIPVAVYPVADSSWVEGNGTIAVRNPSGGSGGSQLTGTSAGDGYDTDNSPAGEMVWDNRPAITGGPIAQVDVSRDSFQTYAFDMTGYIRQQRDAGQSLITVAVSGPQETAHSVRFLSREANTPAGQPQLVITDPNDADGSAVRPAVNAPDMITGGTATHTITITYTDTAAIDVSTIDASDISVTRDGGNSIGVQSVSVDPPFNSSSVTATYVLDAPGDTWDPTDNDLYTIHVKRGEVRDVAGNESISGFNSFRVKAFDSTAPTANVQAANITTGGARTYSFIVNYSDNILFDVATVNVNNVSVTVPGGGRITPRVVTFEPDGDSSNVQATYTIDAPGGDWGAEDNGAYSVTLHTQTARDTAANEVAEFTTPFSVAITGPDVLAPTAAVTANDVTAPSTGPHFVQVLYSDDRGINGGSIGAGDLSVTGPGGVVLAVMDVSVSPGGNGTPQTATYTIAPPAGGWTSAANGQYTVSLRAGEVLDTSGLPAAPAADTFTVAIAPPPPPDTLAPTASINPVDITSGGGVIHAITVEFADNAAVDVSSIGPEDVTISGPGGALTVSGVQVNPPANGTNVSATYQINAPGGTWDSDDDGNYSIVLNAGAVRDTSGNVNSQVSAGFSVNIGGPDNIGPSATINVTDVTGAGGTAHQVCVVFTDDGKVNVATIDPGDISVVRQQDGLPLAVTGVTVDPPGNGSPRTAVYTLAAPGGAWDAADAGTYTVTLNAGQVADRKGNFASPGSATFTVSTIVPDVTPPTASIAPIPPVTAAGDNTLPIDVTYSDNQAIPTSVFDEADLVITGPNGIVLGTVSPTVITGADPNVVTVRYLLPPPGGSWDVSDTGTYTVTLNTGAVTDAAGNAAVLAAPAQFAVNVPAPSPIDLTFGSGGPISTNFVTEAIVAQPDGRLVLVGRRGTVGTADSVGVIQRRNADGTPDPTFGGGDGEIVTDSGQGTVYYAVGIQSDGKIVVAGTMFGAANDSDFVVARYDTFGNLDTSFGAGGRSLADFGLPQEAAYALAVGAEDKVIVGGFSGDHFAVARLTPSGVLDPTFGQGGKNLFDRDGVDVIGALAVQRDGKILAAGASGPNVVLIRLDVNGEKDVTFADQSVLTVPGLAARLEASGPFVDRSQALAIQADDKILVGNFTTDGNFGVARVDLAGNLDATFGTGGIASVDVGGTDDVDALLVQPTGEILAVGTTADANNVPSTAVVAIDQSGKPITGFGTGGALKFDPAVGASPGRELHIGDLVLRAFGTRQADGRLVVSSSNRAPVDSSSSLRRLNVPGTRALPQGSLIGEFGLTAGSGRKGARLVDTLTGAVFTMKGGSGQAFRGEDGRINLILNDAGAGVTVRIKSRARIALGDIVCRGNLRSMQVKTGDLSGTMFVGGSLGKLTIGAVAGTIAVNGAIGSIVADSLDHAKILAGANLGDDAQFGGTGSSADIYGASVIKSVKVRGAISQSIVGAGLNPVDTTFGNDDDVVTPGSAIGTLSARSADENSRFYAAAFKSARLPKKIKDIPSDARFRTA
jgi:uncharacterized delta-60 repeat protein